MAFRFFRRMKIAPGVTLNLSKSGPSFSFGPRGGKCTVGPRGTRKTVGIPGTGLFYTTASGFGSTPRAPDDEETYDLPLKPSGVDWLGDIPEHWETRRLRTIADLRVSNVDKHTKEGEVPVRLCNYTDVYKNTVVTADMPFMAATASRDEIEAFRLRIGDVVITKDSEDWQDIGVPALVAETADDLVCGYHLAILRPRPNVAIGHFLSYALQCRGGVAQLSLAAKGVTRYGLSHGAIKTIALPVPPVQEQEPIARHIDESTASLNGAIFRATREINLIREYRTRLIADVVTGKVDVRDLAPPPGSDELEETIDELEPLDDLSACNAQAGTEGELDEDALTGEVAHAED